MPSKFVIRNFSENYHYHVFNQGVERRSIFLDEEDYNAFLDYLFIYTRPVEEVLERHLDLPMRLVGKNMSEELEMLAYCLMPNHFHLLLKQKNKDGLPKLLKQLTNAYTFYFNQKYERVGSLMQGRYKAVGVNPDKSLIQMVRYLHLNPAVERLTSALDNYRWSSYPDYLGKENNLPVSKERILSFFPSVGAFKGFHDDLKDYNANLEKIKALGIDFT